MKNPDVDTSALPDRDREAAEEAQRALLKTEWEAKQAVEREKPLKIVYSFWDGAGHRGEAVVKQGDTVGQFLRHVLEAFPRELRGTDREGLVYVKEDVVLPHDLTFYELIATKARGKSGPLFDFGVSDDVRMQNDVREERVDSHAGKCLTRNYLERNKNFFPYNRFITFGDDEYKSLQTKTKYSITA